MATPVQRIEKRESMVKLREKILSDIRGGTPVIYAVERHDAKTLRDLVSFFNGFPSQGRTRRNAVAYLTDIFREIIAREDEENVEQVRKTAVNPPRPTPDEIRAMSVEPQPTRLPPPVETPIEELKAKFPGIKIVPSPRRFIQIRGLASYVFVPQPDGSVDVTVTSERRNRWVVNVSREEAREMWATNAKNGYEQW